MRIETQCVAETLNPYTSKAKGAVVDLVLSLLDVCASRQRLVQTFDLRIPHDEKMPFAGKVLDHKLTVDLLGAEWFNNRIRFNGKIYAIDGKPVNGSVGK